MYKAFYATADLLNLPIISMLAFMGVFAAVVIRQWMSGSQNKKQQEMSMLPFSEEESVEGRPS